MMKITIGVTFGLQLHPF